MLPTQSVKTSKLFPLAAGLALLMGHHAQGASQNWVGGSTVDGKWSTSGNWGGTPIPGATSGLTNTDIATFNAAIANTWGSTALIPIVIDLTTQNIGGLNFDTAAGSYYIGTTAGNSLLLTSGGTIQILSTLTATNAVETINAPLVLEGANGTYTFSNNSANGTGAGAGTLNFGGGITGGAAGATVLTLNGTNTNANTISGIIGNGSSTTVAITNSGAGTWWLTGANTYTGLTTVNGGTLVVGNGTTGSLNGTAGTALTFGGSGTFNVSEAASSTQGMGALTLTAGDGTIISTAAGASSTATLTFASMAARTAGATANFSLATNTTAAQNKIVLTSTTNAPLSTGSDNPGIFFGGTQYSRYDTTNSYFRAVTYGTDTNASAIVAAGATLGINDATKDVEISGNITAQTTASVNTLNLQANNLTLSDTNQILSVNGLLSAGASNAQIATAGKLQATAAGNEIVIRVNGTTDALTIVPIIQNYNAGGTASALTKSGLGTLTLSAANTYSGGTTINSGTVKLGNATALGASAGAVSESAGAVLDLNGQTLTNTNALTINGTGISGNGALINSSGTGATYAGLLTLGGASSIVATRVESV